MAFTVSARLSETEKDAAARYGVPVCEARLDDGYFARYYLKGPFLVSIIFNKDNQSVNISYNKLDVSNRFYQESIAAKQYSDVVNYKKFFSLNLDFIIINHLLDVNSDSKEWAAVIKGDFWRRSDGAEAMYDSESKTFTVSSNEYLKYVKKNALKDMIGF